MHAHAVLEAVIGALTNTNWAGAQPSIVALAPIDIWVCDLYNRAERTVELWDRAKARESSQEVPGQDQPADVSELERVAATSTVEE